MTNRHFIYTEARSGSNYVVDILNQHPHLINYGEVLGDWTKPHRLYRFLTRRLPSIAYLNFIYNSRIFFYLAQFYYAYQNLRRRKPIYIKRFSQIHSFGVKDFHHTLSRYNLLGFITNQPGLYIIYLYRRNILKQHISLEMMRATRIVSSEVTQDGGLVEKQIRAKIRVRCPDILEVLAHAENEISEREVLLDHVNPRHLLRIAYEDLFLTPESLSDFQVTLFRFLGVIPIDVKSNQSKLASDRLEELVDNYDELCECLLGTRFSVYLQ